MPSADGLSAVIRFTLPAERLDHDPAVYLTFEPDRERPCEALRVPMTDLKSELDSQSIDTVDTQLAQGGFAIARHKSAHLDGLPEVEGTQHYLDESAELLRNAIGCTRVIAWNSVCRKNDAAVKVKDVPKQKGPEVGYVPTERKQPVASVAHVDQDEVWGRELVGKAAGVDAGTFKRAQIINLWRPLSGPVTNAPLAMLDYRHIAAGDLSKHASQFGIGMDLHHSTGQRWAYIRHQMPDEVIFLKCYDTLQGEGGCAKYCGHVAVEVDDAVGVAPELVVPRESVEVRLVALWE